MSHMKKGNRLENQQHLPHPPPEMNIDGFSTRTEAANRNPAR